MATAKAGKVARRRSPVWLRRLKQGLALFTLIFLGAFITVFVMFLSRLRKAEETLQTSWAQGKLSSVTLPPTRVLTSDGVELFRISNDFRLPLKNLSEVPKHVRDAILAAEDRRFYSHPGVDSMGLLRAMVSVVKEGRVSQGGSTITMQLAKRLFDSPEKSFQRKMSDIAYAYAMEEYLTKDQILLLYLNEAYFGEGAHGIAAAAKVYFNKDLKDVSISEAAMLARCVRSPSRDNPIHDYNVALENRNVVLGIMRDEKMIDEAQYESAIESKPKINPNPPTTSAFFTGGFGQYVVQQALDTARADIPGLDFKTSGCTIWTTIDSKLQKLAEHQVRQTIDQFRGQNVTQGAFVAMNKDGRILCEVGGVSWRKNQYNIITQGAGRQPGSSFKPIVYAVALVNGVLTGPDDYVSNAAISNYDKWSHHLWQPQNSSKRENAPGYSLREALAMSVNRPAIHTLEKIGPSVVVQYAHDAFGIKSELAPYLPLAIGASAVKPIEMLEAYSVFMTGGSRVTPYLVSKVVSADGSVIKEYQSQIKPNVLDQHVTEVMDDLLRSDVAEPYATGYYIYDKVPNARGKTGTTNSSLDAWFDGYADGVVGVGWVGNEVMYHGSPREVPMHNGVYGGTVTAHMWAGIMGPARQRFGDVSSPAASAETVATAPIKTDPKATVQKVAIADEKRLATVPPAQDGSAGGVSVDPAGNPDQTQNPDNPAGLQSHPDPASLTTPRPLDPGQAPTPPKDSRRPRRSQRATDDARRRRQEARNNEPVTVEVCVDTGLKANMYCPETVVKTFTRATAPKGYCKKHGPGQ